MSFGCVSCFHVETGFHPKNPSLGNIMPVLKPRVYVGIAGADTAGDR